ncbi:TIM22 inner membrane protein import complex subunit Tim8 [Schizosaccharomyces japonicus yFS275]|uniref:Mitochondrial import inner membrane translocase subunit n=1 Tax=Schizosaccharomyces japonicus (strain yFS275 / FY16936) TaxID=402676 RepID=B6K2Q8_SCHJY|nr:TIM22 inner membrane protein import complex subunit Tim8 [Schizosaccharomyces japonicus yFS275]EEB07439.1 TIM22 inner membrane protein import complex subunit Tim8 [Schizosaccharomyces japonicus yFS275]
MSSPEAGAPSSELSSKQQQEIAKFIETEQQKAKLQQAIHNFTSICWPKCITKVNDKLGKDEEQCLANCVERYLDCNFQIIKSLEAAKK